MKAAVHTQYGCREIGDIADECQHHMLHVRMDEVLVEAIRHGRPAEPGEPAKAVITDLLNYNMPFIRYEVGDVIALGDGACACGRNTATIEAVHGRAADTIKVQGRDGDRFLTPLQVDELFRGLAGVGAYQLVQRSKNLFHVALMCDGRRHEVDTRLLMERCLSVFGPESQLELEFVQKIRPLPSKKYRFAYSAVSLADL